MLLLSTVHPEAEMRARELVECVCVIHLLHAMHSGIPT